MGTTNRRTLEHGYCENIDQNRYIEIIYVSAPRFDSHLQEFYKIENACKDLSERKCDKGNNCTIFKKANDIKTINEI